MRALVLAPLVGLWLIATPARADDPARRARALYDEAGERERAGDFRGAVQRLRTAIRIRETPHLHYALGWALEQQGDAPLDARAEYEIALEQATRGNVTEVATLARARLAALPPEDRGAAPPARQDAPAALTFATIPPRQEAGSPTAPWVLVATGGALVVSGVVLVALSAADASARDDATARWCAATACANGAATRPETADAIAARRDAEDAAARGNTKQVVGLALGGVGIVGAAVGTFLLVRSSRVNVGASATPGSASVSAAIRF